MISNNKNKNPKELTLEEIIQKSKFRKNIDQICLLETKINKDIPKATNLVSTPVETFSKDTNKSSKLQNFNLKKQIQPIDDTAKKPLNSKTARSSKSYQQPNFSQGLAGQDTTNNYKTIQRENGQARKEIRKSKQNKLMSLDKPLKSKHKKGNQFLCVKGASNNVIINLVKPYTAQSSQRNFMPQYEIKKYHTLVELGSQVQHKQKSMQLKATSQIAETKKYHSFMVNKYSNALNFRNNSIKPKSHSQAKLKNNNPPYDELVKRKVQHRGIKTQQKWMGKVQNAEDTKCQQKSKKMKKYELILNINFEEELRKQTRPNMKNEFLLQSIDKNLQLTDSPHQPEEYIIKQTTQQDQILKKGFKGKKVKSTVQMKTKYFVPDFIKPSLDLVAFGKKNGQQNQTENKQSQEPNQFKKKQTNQEKSFEQLFSGVNGQRLALNTRQETPNFQSALLQPGTVGQNEQLLQQIKSKPIQLKREDSLIDTEINCSKKRPKQKKKNKLKNQEDVEICAWNQTKNKKSSLERREFYHHQYDFD